MRRLVIFILFLFVLGELSAQLSSGGEPIEFPRLKKLSSKVIVDLPYLDNAKLFQASADEMEEGKLKPLRFAESIPVCLNTENSGEWITYNDHKIWTVEIRSSGAKSLNLIFDHYHIPDNARLFIYSEDKEHLIGAFTSENNKSSGILATVPVKGDHIIVQYEEPFDADFDGELSIGNVNHDFIGVLNLKDYRRPIRISGSCNVNINCDHVQARKMESNGVVRLLVSGVELCTGNLLNNTAEDGTPYILTAAHCIKNETQANETVFLFNYESPYCGEIDGDASRSIAGSELKARADNLDFSFVEMSIVPPPDYHPYYLGWDRSSNLPDSSVCIHHPLGDVKKIAIDSHSPLIKTYEDYEKDAFLYIGNWEQGTTERGSSGACLLNQDGRFIGSLTGGAANCANSVRDYFSWFRISWNYYADPAKSLKTWLDPENKTYETLDGTSFYSGTELCGAYTNFIDDDTHEATEIVEGQLNKGFWSGNNDYGFVNFAEKFEQKSSVDVSGVAIGVAKSYAHNSNSTIKILVYNGTGIPTELVYEQEFSLGKVDEGVMNYFEFDQFVTVHRNFFIAYSLEFSQPQDTFVVYMADREEVDPRNTFFIKDGGNWYSYPQKSNLNKGSALLMEVVVCNVDSTTTNPDLKSEELDFEAFPNPVNADNSKFLLNFKTNINPTKVSIYDLTGSLVSNDYEQPASKWLSIDFTGFKTGTYFIQIETPEKIYKTKVLNLQ